MNLPALLRHWVAANDGAEPASTPSAVSARTNFFTGVSLRAEEMGEGTPRLPNGEWREDYNADRCSAIAVGALDRVGDRVLIPVGDRQQQDQRDQQDDVGAARADQHQR